MHAIQESLMLLLDIQELDMKMMRLVRVRNERKRSSKWILCAKNSTCS